MSSAIVAGELVYKMTGDTSGLDSSISQADKKVSSFGGTLKTLAAGFAAYKIADKILDIGVASLKAAANMEQQQVSFTTMLGSAEKAKELLKELEQFAASTPFELNEIVDASKKLIAFGESASQVTTTLTRIGDVASGLNIPLGELTEIYGKARVQNTLYAEDLNQLAGRGIPIFEELAKVMGVQADEVKKLGSQGAITFPMLQEVFKNLTSEGGKFAGLMNAQAQTLAGKWSNFNDQLTKMQVSFGQKLLPTASSMLTTINLLLEKFNEMPKAADGTNEPLAEQKGFWDKINFSLSGAYEKYGEYLSKLEDQEALQEAVNMVGSLADENEDVSQSVEMLNFKYGETVAASALLGSYETGLITLKESQLAKIREIVSKEKERLGLNKDTKQVSEDEAKVEKEKKKYTQEQIDAWVRKKKAALEVYDAIKNEAEEIGLTETEILLREQAKQKKEYDNYLKQQYLTKVEYDELILANEKITQNKIRELEDQAQVDRINKINQYAGMSITSFSDILSAYQGYIEAVGAAEQEKLDAQMQAELEAAGVAEQTATEKAQAAVDAAVASGDAEAEEAARKELKKAQIEEKYTKKKRQAEYETALQSWELQRILAVAQGAQAVLNAYSSAAAIPLYGFTIAPFAAAAAGVAAALQIAAVNASKPQPPKFAEGGVIPGSSFAGDNVIARVNSGEMVLNQNQQAELFRMANGQGGQGGNIKIFIGDDMIYDRLYTASKNGELLIDTRAVITR